MYYNLGRALKRRLILELKDSFSTDTVYRKIVPFIQGRFSFSERPQFGIVVKASGGNKVVLAADNYLGTLQSYVMLAYVGQASFPLEWVKEDSKCVRAHKGMPTAPGVYYLEILEAPDNASGLGYFVIDPLITAVDELVAIFGTSALGYSAQLQHKPLRGTFRLYENHRYMFQEGTEYEVDYDTGTVTFLTNVSEGTTVTADYRYAGVSQGPYEFKWNTANTKALPGVVLAFGKRAAKGDKVAVVVYRDREDVAKVFGGKYEGSFDLDVIAADPNQMEEIADLVFMYLWSQKKNALEFEGLETLDVSIGGEAEDVADETGETFFYQIPVTVQMRADWEIHVPLPLTISRVLPTGLTPVGNSIFIGTHQLLEERDDEYERLT